MFNVPFQHQYGYIRDERSQFTEDTIEPSVFLPGIICLLIMCIGIIWNNSFFSRRTRPGRGWNRSSATTNVTLYCTWRPSGLTTGLHGQGGYIRDDGHLTQYTSTKNQSSYKWYPYTSRPHYSHTVLNELWYYGLLNFLKSHIQAWLGYLSGARCKWFLSAWNEGKMTCTGSSWCHCHPIMSCFIEIQVLTFWCWLTQVFLEKR